MSSKHGLTLVEVVVAVLIGAFVVIAIGGLSERLVHHRTTTDSNSAAMSLAELQMERLLADPNGTPTGCPSPLTTTSPALCAGAHPAVSMKADGASGGPYQVQWTVVNADASSTSPLVIPTPDPTGALQDPVKEITVTVTMPNNRLVNATIVRFKYNLGV